MVHTAFHGPLSKTLVTHDRSIEAEVMSCGGRHEVSRLICIGIFETVKSCYVEWFRLKSLGQALLNEGIRAMVPPAKP